MNLIEKKNIDLIRPLEPKQLICAEFEPHPYQAARWENLQVVPKLAI